MPAVFAEAQHSSVEADALADRGRRRRGGHAVHRLAGTSRIRCRHVPRPAVDRCPTDRRRPVMTWLTDPWSWWVEPFVDNGFMRDAARGRSAHRHHDIDGRHVGRAARDELPRRRPRARCAARHRDRLHHRLRAPRSARCIAAGAMVGGISLIRSHSPLPDDASIGVLFVGFLALAVVVMSTQRASYTGDLNRFLFGSVAGVDDVTTSPGRRSRPRSPSAA